MALRAVIAAVLCLAILAGAAIFVAGWHGGGLADIIGLLLFRQGSVLCSLAAWASLVPAVTAVVVAYASFVETEDDRANDYDGDRRRFPVAAPAFFAALAAALLWVAFLCAGRAEEPARAVAQAAPAAPAAPEPPPSEPASEPEPPSEPVPEPVRVEAPEPSAPEPLVEAFDGPMAWQYMYPLILNGDYRLSPRMEDALEDLFPLDDPDGSVRALLCGKAWVAIGGGASQEGPRERNDRRARLRAKLAADAAEAWLDAHTDDCRRPVVLGVDLGQHEATLADPRPDGADTAYQRQVLIVHRQARPGEAIDGPEAAAQMRAFYDDPEGRAAMLSGRRYSKPAAVFLP